MSEPAQPDDVKVDPQRSRRMKMIFGVMALVSVLLGLVIYLFADALGLEQDLARMIAVVFLLVGLADYIILRFADKIIATGRRRQP